MLGGQREGIGSMSDVEEILSKWRDEPTKIKWVRFELPDMHGISRSKTSLPGTWRRSPRAG